MAVYNRSDRALHQVILVRLVDLDIGNDFLDDSFRASSRSLFAFDASAGEAVALTNLTPGVGRVLVYGAECDSDSDPTAYPSKTPITGIFREYRNKAQDLFTN
jgi:hypothetical protein